MVHAVQKDAFFGLSLTLCTIFKICSQFSVKAIFEKFVKDLSLHKFHFFFFFFFFLSVFQSGAPRCSPVYNELVKNLVKEDFFFLKEKKCIAPKTKHHQITTLKRR